MYEDVLKAIDVLLKANEENQKKELEKMGYVNPKESVEMISAVEDIFADSFEEVIDIINNELDEDITPENIEDYIDVIYEKLPEKQLSNFMKEEYEDKIITFGNSYLKQSDKNLFFDIPSKFTSNFINKWSENLITSINDETLTGIKGILEDGVNAGNSIEETALKISDCYGLSRERARLISLNETLRAHSYAKNESSLQNPSVTKIRWRHSGTSGIKARKSHMDLDGTVINKGEYFKVNGYEARFPRDAMLPPEESINCHCTFEEIVDKDILGLSLEERLKLQAEVIAELDDHEELDDFYDEGYL